MKQIRVGFVGTGQIALANHLPGLRLCPEAKVVALCDNDRATLDRASAQVEGARLTTDWNELVRDDDIDALIVATPNFVHPPVVIAAAQAGKHVMSEKPLALNVSDAKAMWEAAEDAGVQH